MQIAPVGLIPGVSVVLAATRDSKPRLGDHITQLNLLNLNPRFEAALN